MVVGMIGVMTGEAVTKTRLIRLHRHPKLKTVIMGLLALKSLQENLMTGLGMIDDTKNSN